ncbi:unnamed protein product [Prorocentrum cordatum]|uniref:RNA-binding S4 domain-containing protein n=1 Tax=Prorocentrum cordatum TaxID=2364126 RepID=A0ABN9RTX1_9DINO|nr:unnamed protein product [Polarella glacialis]
MAIRGSKGAPRPLLAAASPPWWRAARLLRLAASAAPARSSPLLRRVAQATNRTVRACRKLVAQGQVLVDGQRCCDTLLMVAPESPVVVVMRDETPGESAELLRTSRLRRQTTTIHSASPAGWSAPTGARGRGRARW